MRLAMRPIRVDGIKRPEWLGRGGRKVGSFNDDVRPRFRVRQRPGKSLRFYAGQSLGSGADVQVASVVVSE